MTQVITAAMPVQRGLRMKKGADWRMTITAKEDDQVTPRDITGWDVILTIKDRPNGDQMIQLTIGDGIALTPASGRMDFEILSEGVDELEFSRATYDIIIIDANDDKTCPFYGDVELIP